MHKLRLTYLMIIAGLLMFTSVSAQVDTLKLQADQAYVDENYADAAAAYEKILSQEYVSAELYFNLGNAYFKSGQIASSILNYERALKLAPADEDILFNLRLANLSVKDRVEEIPQMFFVRWWKTVLNVFTVDGWAWSVVIALLLSLAGFLLFKFSSDEGMRRLTFYTAAIALIWAGFSLYAAQKSFNHAVNDDRAVVFAYTINAKSAPDEKGKDLFVIHEGLVVTVSDELNGWVRIKLSNGNVGWVESRVVVPI